MVVVVCCSFSRSIWIGDGFPRGRARLSVLPCRCRCYSLLVCQAKIHLFYFDINPGIWARRKRQQNLSLIGGNREREDYYLFHVQSLKTELTKRVSPSFLTYPSPIVLQQAVRSHQYLQINTIRQYKSNLNHPS